jgi:hypothetical protein
MTQIDDGQSASITNGEADAAVKGAGGVTAVPVPTVAALASVPVFVSGTAKQLSTTKQVDLYINVTTAAALGITMGATSAGTGVTLNTSESDALGLLHILVPVGWYVVVTGTVANLAFNALIH